MTFLQSLFWENYISSWDSDGHISPLPFPKQIAILWLIGSLGQLQSLPAHNSSITSYMRHPGSDPLCSFHLEKILLPLTISQSFQKGLVVDTGGHCQGYGHTAMSSSGHHQAGLLGIFLPEGKQCQSEEQK